MWVAVYDILLDWIDPSNVDFHPSGYAELLRPTHVNTPTQYTLAQECEAHLSNAYADDLATLTSGPRAFAVQQQQAEWISAFCAFTGLQLNMKKIVPVTLGTHSSKIPGYITVYDNCWQPTRCPIQNCTSGLTYLGLSLDHIIAGNSSADFKALYQRAHTMIEHLLDQPGSCPAKIDYIRFKIYPLILHSAQCANWSLQQYRQLDKPFTAAYKTILVLPIHFPTELLYQPSTNGGVGLPRLSDRAQVMKWRAFHRSLAVGQSAAKAIAGILSRLPHSSHSDLPLSYINIPPLWHPYRKLIARSLIDWLSQSGLLLTQCTAETPQQTMDRQRNITSITTIAKAIHLQFDEEIHDPDLPLLPLSFYVTDGSF
jgi:hypothetical protein